MTARTKRRWLPVAFFVLAPLLFLAGAIGMAPHTRSSGAPGGVEDPVVVSPAGAGIDASIAALQARLRRVPEDAAGLASLGLAYVQKARVSVDPAYYGKAQAVLDASLRIDDQDNFAAASGMAALAAARHDFERARQWAERGLAVNSSNATLYGALVDALTQLGRYDEALAATQRMVDLRPDSASLARVSYSWELRGDGDRARAAMQRALDDATAPADRAFARYHLGALALARGDADEAIRQYDAGLRADAAYLALYEGRARAEAALGRNDDALRDFARVTDAIPEPSYLIEHGELLESLGRVDEAQAQYALFDAEEQLFRANGVTLDVESALFHADHGDPKSALAAAEAGIRSRPFLDMEDAYAWALHVNGNDTEALEWSTKARRLGTRSALFLYHAGMIEEALGQFDQARTDLSAALGIDPHFSPLHAPVARRVLAALVARPG